MQPETINNFFPITYIGYILGRIIGIVDTIDYAKAMGQNYDPRQKLIELANQTVDYLKMPSDESVEELDEDCEDE